MPCFNAWGCGGNEKIGGHDMRNKFERGAEWRKWDLHIHTPCSIVNGYGGNTEEVWKEFILSLEQLPPEVKVIGINDYYFIDGYEKVMSFKDSGRLKNIDKIFPVLEFRIDTFASATKSKFSKINVHIIFDLNASNLKYEIEQVKEEFIGNIKLSKNHDTEKLTLENLQKYASDNKLKTGFSEIIPNTDNLFETINSNKWKGKSFIIIGYNEWNNLDKSTQLKPQKKELYSKADAFFTASPTDDMSKKEEVLGFMGGTKENKALLHSGDIHDFSSLNTDKNYKCFTWIKADPTFDGLKQIINEPDDRVYIGEKPPIFTRIASNRTKYINELKITSVDEYDGKYGKWFKDISIPLNKELVAIIGHKGSGKSAIADIISLCSNYCDSNNFSFLTGKKFREKNGKIAKNFNATLQWESNYSISKSLNDIKESTDEKGVKYLPQGQFERLTNEIDTTSKFQKEIEKVVFSHVKDSEKYGAHSFSELIESKKNILETELDVLYKNIESLNSETIKLEIKNTSIYKSEIEAKLNKKKDELNALTEPPVVSNPNEDPEKKKQNEDIIKKINTLNGTINALKLEKDKKVNEKSNILIALKDLNDTKKEIKLKVSEIELFISDKKEKLSSYTIDFSKLISFKADFTELDEYIFEQEKKLGEIKIILGEKISQDNKIPIQEQIIKNQGELEKEQGRLNTEQKKYQEYLNAKKLWKEEREKIIGDDLIPKTITYYEKEIKYLKNSIESELKGKYEDLIEVTRNVFKKKQEVSAIYKDVKNSISRIINENTENLTDYKIEIDASLVKRTDFNTRFFSYINNRKAGTYYSNEGAEKELLKIVSDVNFDDEDSVISFIKDLLSSLLEDKREGQENVERLMDEQVANISDLYNYLFKLEFIDFNYQLKQGDKKIEQLSPGERGALLLVFYLLLDKNDIPLIIDQPEDNLDNDSIVKILVPFIRAAKAKRQIIMITHNPNLAVVADAEQIIYVNIDKHDNYNFSTINGSIENKKVNAKIVEVLEGAMPAFNKRKNKYYE